ncbi:DUF6318 family protein [Phycicoccus flavus]|uniref:DUF6318 family protein n=1 Tax=Phycicoccus flavus TaxID=2502783 RepID=UPI000FEB8396|nr:DUF6318 family protein [Phycicoccus flavus]NHA68746.1 hypothetical protein [Phycicoccus flavus]
MPEVTEGLAGEGLMTRAGSSTAVVLAGLLALSVSACDSSGADDPSPSPSASSPAASPTTSETTSPDPSPSASPSPSGSDIPAAARKQTDAGAEAFVRYYIAQSGRAWTKPDPSLLDGLSTRQCSSCSRLSDVAADLASKKQRYDASPIRISKMKTIRSSSSEVAFEASLVENAVRVVDRKGSTVDSYPERRIVRAISTVWRDERWLLNGIGE